MGDTLTILLSHLYQAYCHNRDRYYRRLAIASQRRKSHAASLETYLGILEHASPAIYLDEQCLMWLGVGDNWGLWLHAETPVLSDGLPTSLALKKLYELDGELGECWRGTREYWYENQQRTCEMQVIQYSTRVSGFNHALFIHPTGNDVLGGRFTNQASSMIQDILRWIIEHRIPAISWSDAGRYSLYNNP